MFQMLLVNIKQTINKVNCTISMFKYWVATVCIDF